MSYNAATFLAGLFAPAPTEALALASAAVDSPPAKFHPAPDAGSAQIQSEPPGGPQAAGRLIARELPPIVTPTPPDAILATPAAICPTCGRWPVLAELRHLTRGRCYGCFANPTRQNVPTQNNFPHGAKYC